MARDSIAPAARSARQEPDSAYCAREAVRRISSRPTKFAANANALIWRRAVILGASGGIGAALADSLAARNVKVARLARSAADPADRIDLLEEPSIARAAERLAVAGPLDLVIVASGVLHNKVVAPEKNWRELSAPALAHFFAVNAIGPALVAKHFLPLLPRRGGGIFASLSARVGSIGDNRLGGWYGYRASKAALNMMIRTLAIELARTRPEAICVCIHPGTVDTSLSKPFQRSVRPGRLFTPEEAAAHILNVLGDLTPQDSGDCFAWDGSKIAF